MRSRDLSVIKTPYVVIGLIVFAIMAVFILTPMPSGKGAHASLTLPATFGLLFRNRRYLEGVVTQGFYVGAQIMCWTFIIHYATGNLGMSAASAQNHNIVAMAIFCASRFICTFFLRYISPGRLLMLLSSGAILLILGVIFVNGHFGLYCLIGVSACMSLMFPTIYGIALDGMGDEAKIASAGLIFAIVGGALMPPLQGTIIDLGGADGLLLGLPSVSVSFVLPLFCFVVIAVYGLRTVKVHHEKAEAIAP
jgi:FHS family L-fucose permease-like MFS transporter